MQIAPAPSCKFSMPIIFIGLLLTFFLAQPAMSKGVFEIFLISDPTTSADTFSNTYKSVEDAFDQLDHQELVDVLPSYTNNSSLDATVDFRGLEMIFSFNANSPTLFMNIPGLNITETFPGQDRNESADLLTDYLKSSDFTSLQQIQKELVRVSPVDPVAGNPASLMASMVDSDFAQPMSISPMEFMSTPGGRELLNSVMPNSTLNNNAKNFGSTLADSTPTDSIPDISPTRTSENESNFSDSSSGDSTYDNNTFGDSTYDDSTFGDSTSEHDSTTENESNYNITSQAEHSSQGPEGTGSSFGIDMSYAQFDMGDNKVSTQTIVFEYQYQFKDPLQILRVKMPLGITDTEGSKSYDVDFGIAYSHPLTRSWTITPGVSYGVGGSEDLGGAAAINGYSLLSSYRFIVGNYLFNLGNMVGHYATGSVSLGDYEIDPGVSNTVYRNGLVILKPYLLFNVPTMTQLILIDTQYSGDDLYTEHYYELGFALGLITDDDLLAEDSFNLGLTYLDSTDSDIKGYKVNFGYRF